MNPKRLLLSFIGVFLFIFFYEWMFHGTCLKELYTQTAHLWRTEAAMQERFHWLVLGQLLTAFVFCFIYAKGYENSGRWEGLRFGLIAGAFLSAPNFVMYAVAPYPGKLVAYWLLGGLIEFAIAGILIGLLYRPNTGVEQRP